MCLYMYHSEYFTLTSVIISISSASCFFSSFEEEVQGLLSGDISVDVEISSKMEAGFQNNGPIVRESQRLKVETHK